MLANWIQGNELPILIGAVITLSCILVWISRASPLQNVPGPWLNKYLGVRIALAEMRGHRSQQVVAWHQQYGPIICIAPTQISIASLPTIREIYSSTGRADKSPFFNHFVAFNRRSVFTTLSFPDHKRKRAVLSAFFQGSTIYGQPAIEAFIRNHALAILSQVEERGSGKRPVDFYPLADWYAFDNVAALVFGPQHASATTKHPCEEREILRDLKQGQAWSPLRQRFPWLIPIVKMAVHIHNGNTGQFDAERRLAQWTYDRTLRTLQDRNAVGFDNLAVYLARKLGLNLGPGALQETYDDHAHGLVEYIAAEVLDNINAAEASVAATITYVIWYVSINPKWQQRLRTELLALPVKSDGLPSFNDLDRAPILDACLKEVYRLKPASGGRAERVIPAGGRVVSDVYVPEKTVVAASIIAVHTDPAMFPDESRFCPSRWLEADEATLARLNASVIPFGYGARVCLGKVMANMEIKILLAAMFLRYEIVPASVHTGASMKQAAARDGVRSGLSGEFYCRPFPGPNWQN
ncbi:benzoate 4-monooxygenase cytochrome P450 [Aspergillus steynii IBT 23096]|uniref:Benzoate 4-monooxygenase cytochrome P450 n=1 Tax=Aspergillus steynii IBT 23096 TaxID=1392250 RepID=A0A2I2GLJ5_9EURO|nr:benzoate 4-monooxygenase cytochrome P450 [Aspergillus steynii IBT 23096]PLB53739.1 benzoate 4-monooxygenase cytochrome P450 [Aspergillus steynii IBT 23096]